MRLGYPSLDDNKYKLSWVLMSLKAAVSVMGSDNSRFNIPLVCSTEFRIFLSLVSSLFLWWISLCGLREF